MEDPVQFQLRFNSPAGGSPAIFDITAGQNLRKLVARVVRSVMNDIYEDQGMTNMVVPAGLNTEDFQAMRVMCDRFNKAVASKKELKNGQTEGPRRCSPDALKDLLRLVYQLSIGDPKKLNKYRVHTAATYGEAGFDVIHEMLEKVQLGSDATVVDLGSGVGQVVLQIAASAGCLKVYGIECADIPSGFAKDMGKNFRSLMEWGGFEYSQFQLMKGNFMSSEYKDIINDAELIFVNNYSFDPELIRGLEQVFMDQKQKTVIVSSKSFGRRNGTMNMYEQITERNKDSFAVYLDEKRYFSIKGKVSWVAEAVTFHGETVDIELAWIRQEKYYAKKREVKTTKRNSKGKKVVKEKSLKMDAASRTLLTASSDIDGNEINEDSIAEEEAALAAQQPMKVAKEMLADILQKSKKSDECIPGQGCLEGSVLAAVEEAVQLDSLIPPNNDTATNQQPVGQESTPEPVPHMGDVEEENEDKGDDEPEVKKKRPSEEIREGSRRNEMEELDSGINAQVDQSEEPLNVRVPESCAQQAEGTAVRNEAPSELEPQLESLGQMRQQGSGDEIPSVRAETKEQRLAQQEPLDLTLDEKSRRVMQMHPEARNWEMLAAQCTSIVPHVNKVDETSSTSTQTNNARDEEMPKVPTAHEQRYSSVPADFGSELAQNSNPPAKDLTVVRSMASADDPPGNVMQELPIMAAGRRAFPRPVIGGCWLPGDYWPGVASSDLRFEVQGRILQFRVTSMGVDCDTTEA